MKNLVTKDPEPTKKVFNPDPDPQHWFCVLLSCIEIPVVDQGAQGVTIVLDIS
jgi:hypothetical protein